MKKIQICLVTLLSGALLMVLPQAQGQTKPKEQAKPSCAYTDFRTIGLSIHHPEARLNAALSWLRTVLPYCTLDQARVLAANRGQWFGTADDVNLAAMIDRAIELLATDQPEVLRSLYASNTAEGPAWQATTNTVTAASSRFITPDPAAQAWQQQPVYQQPYQQAYPQPMQQAYPQAYPQQVAPQAVPQPATPR